MAVARSHAQQEHQPAMPQDGTVAGKRSVRSVQPAELLARLWKQNLPLMQERVRCLEAAANEAAGEGLTAGTRAQAIDLSHKLAGSLGMFGYPRGTDVAREIEQLLEDRQAPDPVRLGELVSALRAALPL